MLKSKFAIKSMEVWFTFSGSCNCWKKGESCWRWHKAYIQEQNRGWGSNNDELLHEVLSHSLQVFAYPLVLVWDHEILLEVLLSHSLLVASSTHQFFVWDITSSTLRAPGIANSFGPLLFVHSFFTPSLFLFHWEWSFILDWTVFHACY